jgi:hypothetical protein
MKHFYTAFHLLYQRDYLTPLRIFCRTIIGRFIPAICVGVLLLAFTQQLHSQSPSPVTNGLVLHLDASAIQGLNTNDPVSQWDDLSGNGHHAIQNTEVNQPVFIADGLNGKPVVRFDGIRTYLETAPFSSSLDQPNTVIIVWKTRTSSTQFAIDGITSSRNSIFQRINEIAFFAGTSQEYIRSTPFDWLVTTALFGGPNSEIWENGESKATGNTGSSSLTGALIGSRYEYRNFLNGDIAEILIYNRSLSFSERSQVEFYISKKYGFCASPAPVTTGLVLHLDASYLDLNEEDGIETWTDLSVNNYHATQASENLRPKYKNSGINGNPVVAFDGVDDYLITSPFSAISQPNTVFVVWKANTRGLQFVVDGIANTNRHGIFQRTDRIEFFAGNSVSYTDVGPLNGMITTAIFNGAGSEIWENGESKATGNIGSHSLTGITVGARQAHSTGFLDGDIAEILIYNRALNQNERIQIELYLDGKYALMSEWVEWTGTEDTDWAIGSNWSSGVVPLPGQSVLIPSDLTNYPILNTSAEVKNLLLHPGAELTINNGDLTVNKSAILNGILENNGTLTISLGAFITIKPDGSLNSEIGILLNLAGPDGLLIESNAWETGSIIVNDENVDATFHRYVSGNEWHIISSPVKDQGIQDFIANSNIAQNTSGAYAMTHYSEDRYVNAGGWAVYYDSNTTGNMESGEGYLAARRGNGVLVFSGKLASAQVNVGIVTNANGWNALGNPYASAIRVKGSPESFLQVNKIDLHEDFQAIYIYDPGSGDYTAINLADTGLDTYNIQPGQGFLVKSKKDGGTVSFTPSMRIHDNESFFKKASTGPWPFVQLQVSFNSRQVNTLIAFNDKMTKGLDPGYDAGQFGADPGFRLYTRLVEGDEETNFTIQALPDFEYEDLVIPVGFDFAGSGEVVFSADLMRLPKGVAAVLEDRELGVFTSLMNENIYKVNIEEITGPGRFFLHTDIQITNVEDPVEPAKELLDIYSFNKEIYISGEVGKNSSARIVDLMGREIKSVRLADLQMNSFRVDELGQGIYLVQVYGGRITGSKRVFIE